jgi:hypothetical protein
MRVDLEHEPVRPAVPLDPDPVDDPVVERAAVDPAEQLTQPAARHRLAVDEGGRATHLLGGDPPPVGQLERDLLPVVGNGQVEIDLAGAGERRRVEHRHRPPRHPGGHLGRDPLGQSGADLGRLAQPHRDVVGDGIGAAPGDRVVPGGLHQPPPPQLQELLRPAASV